MTTTKKRNGQRVRPARRPETGPADAGQAASEARRGEADGGGGGYGPLPVLARLFFYGMHGFLDEVVFTALYEIVVHRRPNYQLVGHSSVYSFVIYGSASFVVERLYVRLRHRLPLVPRVAVYVCVAYTWELSSGLLLRRFGACPWDYSDHAYHFLGLITLAYAPFWALCGLWQDVLSRYLLNLRVVPPRMRLT